MSSFDQEVIIKPTVKENRNSPTLLSVECVLGTPLIILQPATSSQSASQPASQSASMDR